MPKLRHVITALEKRDNPPPPITNVLTPLDHEQIAEVLDERTNEVLSSFAGVAQREDVQGVLDAVSDLRSRFLLLPEPHEVDLKPIMESLARLRTAVEGMAKPKQWKFEIKRTTGGAMKEIVATAVEPKR